MATLSQEVEAGSIKDSLETPSDEQQATVEFYNGVPHFPEGYKFGKYEICERIGWDDSIGATYFVMDPSKSLELVLRIDKFTDKNSILPLEKLVLNEADRAGKHNIFSQTYDSGLWFDCGYYCKYFRGGPSLRQICDFMRGSRAEGEKFSASTTGRFAENLFQIIRFLHSKDIILCGLNQDMFQFCGASRNLFLSDLSSIRREPTKELSHLAKWGGSLDYMPIHWTNPEMIKRNMEVEAVFYMVLKFALGSLPWDSVSFDDCLAMKEAFDKSDELKKLPEAYQKLWELSKEISKSDKVYESLEPVLNQCIKIYKDLGGCKDLDEDMDFERQPTPEELPRFVMEKNPASDDQPSDQPTE